MNKQLRNWCFTLNNPTDTELEELKTFDIETHRVKYMVFQLEEAKTIHVQGYIEFARSQRFKKVKSLPSFSRAHLEL